jgi:energy-coupling factor transporter ATP-binding protein EcfA2
MVHRGIDDRWDFVIVIDGREGSGKSTLALHMKAIFDGGYNLNNVLFDASSVIRTMRTAKRGSCVLVDEAIISLYKREALKDFQMTLVKAFSIVRARNLFFILVLPNFNDLDPNIRTRCNYRFYAHADRGRRGYLDVYQPKRTPWSAGSLYQELIWTYKFPALPEAFQTEYDKFKESSLDDALRDFQADVEKKVKEAQSRTEFGRVDTIKERIWNYLDDNPQADRFEIAKATKCTPAYARDIIRSIRGTEDETTEGKDTEKGTGT